MKEFDSIKFILILAALATAGAGGGYWWLGKQIKEEERSIRRAKSQLKIIGELGEKIRVLKDEVAKDKLVDTSKTAMTSYLGDQARMAGLRIQSVNDKGEEEGRGYSDWRYSVNFKQPVAREQLVRFLFHVETNSPRVRLVTSQWTLRDPSESDKWTADMTFLRRDPEVATVQ